MDFDKIKPAVEEIALDDIQKAKILNSCKNKKRKSKLKPLIGIAAAAAVITVVLASPGFLFRASAPDKNAADSAAGVKEEYDLYAEEDVYDDIKYAENSSATTDYPLFNAEDFHDIYAIIPYEFRSLVDDEEYEIWANGINADGGMAMVQFVEHFNVSREDFEAANALYNERIRAHLSDTGIGFDADIIYSGDRNKIDGFYKK